MCFRAAVLFGRFSARLFHMSSLYVLRFRILVSLERSRFYLTTGISASVFWSNFSAGLSVRLKVLNVFKSSCPFRKDSQRVFFTSLRFRFCTSAFPFHIERSRFSLSTGISASVVWTDFSARKRVENPRIARTASVR